MPPSISATAPDISRVRSWAFQLGPTATADDQGARRDSRGAVASAWGKQMDMFNTSEMNYAAGPKPGNPLSQDGLCVNLRGWNKSLVCITLPPPCITINYNSHGDSIEILSLFKVPNVASATVMLKEQFNGITHILSSCGT